MRISEAIALGRTLIQPLAGVHLTGDQTQGCAWGMVQMAAGRDNMQALHIASNRIFLTLPCGCTGNIIKGGMTLGRSTGREALDIAIVHLFNDHVMTKKDWSMEKLIDWLATVEPADPEEVQAEPVKEVVTDEVYSLP